MKKLALLLTINGLVPTYGHWHSNFEKFRNDSPKQKKENTGTLG